MPIRRTEATHEVDHDQSLPPDAAEGNAESPSGDRMQGANGPLHQPDPDDTNPSGDQDIDTAGTDADDQSPTKAMGTGIARPRSRG
jgi:hypothetical protein